MPVGQSVLDLLQELGCGALLLDKEGRVLETNGKARRYLGAQLNIKRRGGMADGLANGEIQDALRKALRISAQVVPVLADHIIVPRPESRPLLLRRVVLHGMPEATGEQLTAIV